MADRLLDNVVENILGHRRIVVAPPPVLAQRRGIEHLVRQLQPQKPAVGDIHLDLAHQLALRADPEQVTDEQRLEHQRRIQRRTANVCTIKIRNALVDERKVDHRIDLAQKVILGNKLIERHHLESCLVRAWLLQHKTSESKTPSKSQGFVSSLKRLGEPFFTVLESPRCFG